MLRLLYWNARGLMEPARMMCAISGTEFADERHSSSPDDAALEANLGRMPVLVTKDGVAIGQSAAIYHYIAETQGFLGANAAEAARIIAITEHLKELNAVWSKLVPWGTVPTEEALTAFFDDNTAADVKGVADRTFQSKRALRWFLGRLESQVGEKFAVGDKLSLADVLIFYVLGDAVEPTAENKSAAHRAEPFSSAARMQKVLADHPKLASIVENVRGNEQLQKYRAHRPQVV